MTTKTIHVNEDIYKRLFKVAEQLQTEMKHSVSVDEAIEILMGNFRLKNKISDLAGTWDISEEEVETIKKSIKDGWRRWKIHRQYCDYA
jgi:predicted CopG family antitoxin